MGGGQPGPVGKYFGNVGSKEDFSGHSCCHSLVVVTVETIFSVRVEVEASSDPAPLCRVRN